MPLSYSCYAQDNFTFYNPGKSTFHFAFIVCTGFGEQIAAESQRHGKIIPSSLSFCLLKQQVKGFKDAYKKR